MAISVFFFFFSLYILLTLFDTKASTKLSVLVYHLFCLGLVAGLIKKDDVQVRIILLINDDHIRAFLV